jgi:hypothetical protein
MVGNKNVVRDISGSQGEEYEDAFLTGMVHFVVWQMFT